jgi:hypothetical protein
MRLGYGNRVVERPWRQRARRLAEVKAVRSKSIVNCNALPPHWRIRLPLQLF